ncbi:MAG TPA: PDZ domain-containing protein [Spirochaetota bacterium]|nr:PDZ domain-containing protein [Spirochaetota bacterium]HQG43618.1 PDZ domain-containing protein [Spirochaetota bacterium]HQI39257.1 PDZ domain-containing protein [Spirochaetota bacterium]HXK65448.1 PDZ domain-containing protein [Spirochaetota bacterium]
MNSAKSFVNMIAISSLLIIGGCVSQQEVKPVKKFPFPEPIVYNIAFCKPVNVYTKEKADAILQNLQPYIYQLRSEDVLAKTDDVIVDNEAIKINWNWEELQTETLSQKSTTSQENDVTGDVIKGILSGKKEDMIGALISGAANSSSQTTTTNMQVTKKVEKHNKTIIMFEDVSNIFRFMSNYIIIRLKSGEDVYIICNNEYYLQKWIDAFMSAMKARGYNTDFTLGVMCQKQPMNAEQIDYLQVNSGAVVLGIMPGSPAAEMGLEYLDVITKVNGMAISSGEELTAYIKSKKPKNNERLTFEIVKSKREGEEVSKVVIRKDLIVKN